MERKVVEVKDQTEESGGWMSFPAAPSITVMLLSLLRHRGQGQNI